MKRKSRSISTVMALLLLLLMCNSCSLHNGSDNKLSQPVTQEIPKVKLRFINSWGGVDSKSDTLQQIFTQFEKNNPGVEIVNECMYGDDFLPKIKTDFASGNDPDVFGLWPGSDIRSLIHAGRVADLTDTVEKDPEWQRSFLKSSWAYTQYQNRIYGVPLEIIFEGMYINQDLFMKYNVKIPATFDELKQAVVKFRANNITPIAYNYMAEGSYLYQNIVAMLGSKEEIEHPFVDGHVNKCYLDAVGYMKQLNGLDAFPSNYVKLNNVERNNLFKEKKAAMIVQGSWFIGELKDQDDSVNIIPFPAIDGKRPSSIIYGLGCGAFYMSTTASIDKVKRDYSTKLIKALTSNKTAVTFANQTGMLSAVDISNSGVNYSRLVKRGQELINSAKILLGPPDSFVERTAWEEDLVKEFPYILEGRETAESVWEKTAKDSMITDH